MPIAEMKNKKSAFLWYKYRDSRKHVGDFAIVCTRTEQQLSWCRQ